MEESRNKNRSFTKCNEKISQNDDDDDSGAFRRVQRQFREEFFLAGPKGKILELQRTCINSIILDFAHNFQNNTTCTYYCQPIAEMNVLDQCVICI